MNKYTGKTKEQLRAKLYKLLNKSRKQEGEDRKMKQFINKELFFLIAIIAMVILISIASGYEPFASIDWRAYELHSSIEAIGGFIVILMAFTLILGKKIKTDKELLIALGFLSMGILDCFHAITSPGDEFVFLHSVALFFGGLFFALIIVSKFLKALHALKTIVWLVIIVSCLIGILTIIFPSIIPAMEENNEFTALAKAINTGGGILFLIGSIYLYIDYVRSKKGEDFQLVVLALLLALAGLTFQYSTIWDGEWWLWHILRLIAYSIVSFWMVRLFIRSTQLTELLLFEHKQTEKILRKTNDEKDKFFSIITHDLKSPFNSILGFSDLLVEQVQEKDYDGIEKYAEIIQDSSKLAVDLLMNLMEWTRSQTGRMEFTPEYLGISDITNETIDLLRPIAVQKSITIKNEISPKTIAFADNAMINTVIRNLISNAIKFTKSGGEIVVSAHKKPNELLISVSDTGIGIPKDRIEKLFILGESYSTTGTNKEKGTGLGLILCKEFVEKNGGKIRVESDPDGKSGAAGSTFHFTIPVKPL